MGVIDVVRQILDFLLLLFLIFLFGRLVIDWIQVFSRDWRPKGPMLVIAESVYSVTDPPLRAVRRVIPPLKLGSVSLDLAFMVLVLGVYIARVVL